MLNQRLLFVLLLLVFASVKAAATEATINISLDRSRVVPGETVSFTLDSVGIDKSPINAVLLRPSAGATELTLQQVPNSPGTYRGQISLAADAPDGMYVIHAWTGEAENPRTVGKATFLLGQVVADFFIAPYLDETQPGQDLENYLKDFRQLGGNFLVAHNLITPTKAFYPSKIAKTDVVKGSPGDIVELVLSRADKGGYAVLLSVSWDMTRQSPYKDRMKEIRGITDELYALYKHHPSLVGFYSYQEGSGTYYVPYVREFSEHVKQIHQNLLTACAPHMDDPLLAGYLGTVEELDILIYQTGVMASYRTDNRKKYPFRRVKDFCSLAAGAKRLQNKISINHVELFGYLENRLTANTTATTYGNIYPQILSAATVTDADGISFFTYHAHVYVPLKKIREVEQSRRAVFDGVHAFKLIASQISKKRNPLTVYFPYSDWIIERWPNYFLPALDAFRVLGIPFDVLPYAPRLDESVYPYYPFNLNPDVLKRLLRDGSILVLPNVSGFQQTDSDLMKAFVEEGGVILAFGPQLPMGRSYERREFMGVDETTMGSQRKFVIVRHPNGKRVKAGSRFRTQSSDTTTWTATGAQVVATFDDGSPAMAVHRFGKGTVISVMLDAPTAAQYLPELTRDTVDYALTAAGITPLVDVVGSNEQTDLAVGKTATGFRLAVVNHGMKEIQILLRPLTKSDSDMRWFDLVKAEGIATSSKDYSLKLSVPATGFRALEFTSTEKVLARQITDE
ncbi:MAG TPA: DUF4434 domain-containing protein [Pyrinomonadaceae bacterium]|nr:DUF4434 domain-containing protein [Pyrinomonadaceae bacterium]